MILFVTYVIADFIINSKIMGLEDSIFIILDILIILFEIY